MIAFIITVVIALFVVLVRFTWYRLEVYENKEKVILCIIGILISLIITSILFSISSNGIEYIDIEVKQKISKILILVFTPVNGIIFMPFIAKTISNFKLGKIETKDVTKTMLILCIIFIVLCFIEAIYLKNIQLGIFEVANGM